MISIEHEKRQKPTNDPLFRDSLYFNAFDPVRKIGISTSIGLRPNLGQAEVAFIIFKENEILLPYVEAGLEIPESDWDKMCIGNVCYRWLKPLEEFKISYTSNAFKANLVWTAITPFFDYSKNIQQLPEIVYSLHYEQAGRVVGEIDYGGEYLAFKGYGIRDHSAGVRDWNRIDRWYFVSGIFEEDFIFCLWTVNVKGEEKTGGWVYKGGKMIGVAAAQYNLKYKDVKKTQHIGGEIRFVDDNGKEYNVTSDVITKIFPFDFGQTVLNEAYAEYRYNGRVGYGLFELLWRK